MKSSKPSTIVCGDGYPSGLVFELKSGIGPCELRCARIWDSRGLQLSVGEESVDVVAECVDSAGAVVETIVGAAIVVDDCG